MSDLEWTLVLALAGVGAAAGIALIERWRHWRPVLVFVMVASWAGATAIPLRDRIATNLPLLLVGVALAGCLATASWLFLRWPDRRFYSTLYPSVQAPDPESLVEDRPLDNIDLLAHLLVKHHGEERAKAMVLRAQERRQRLATKDDEKAVPIPVVAKRIQREPNRADRHLRRLAFVDFSRLAQKLFEPGLQQMAEANRAADSFTEAARRMNLDLDEAYRRQIPDFGELARRQLPNFSELAKEAAPEISDLFDEGED